MSEPTGFSLNSDAVDPSEISLSDWAAEILVELDSALVRPGEMLRVAREQVTSLKISPPMASDLLIRLKGHPILAVSRDVLEGMTGPLTLDVSKGEDGDPSFSLVSG